MHNERNMEELAGTKSGSSAIHPYWVLLAAVAFPGSGQMLCGQPTRGMIMQMFMICLGFVTWQLTTPAQSIIGRMAGGLFLYAMSVLDAYRIASMRHAAARHLARKTAVSEVAAR